MPKTTESSTFINLQVAPVHHLVDKALAHSHVEKIRAEIAPTLASADASTRELASHLISIVGALSAQVATLTQALEQHQRSRAERIRVDPLQFIPAERRTVVPTRRVSAKIVAGSPGFSGMGWYAAETDGEYSWRWSGNGKNATLVLPTLGGGKLRITLDVIVPFGHSLGEAALSIIVNDELIAFHEAGSKSMGTSLIGEVELPEDDGLGSFTLVIQSIAFRAPESAVSRETRKLGLGLYQVAISRDQDGTDIGTKQPPTGQMSRS